MNEAHARFGEWLAAGAEGEPARDLAVHASVCAGCRQSMAALDLLSVVDPGRAAGPASAFVSARGSLAAAARKSTAIAGAVLGAVVVGIAASQLITLTRTGPGGPVAQASSTPDQAVLGGTQTPGTASSAPSGEGSLGLEPTSQPTAAPGTAAPGAAAPGAATPRPTPRPTPQSTPRPTAVPTTNPTPSPGSSASLSPSSEPTTGPTPTPVPIPSPTHVPTPTPTPTPTPSAPSPPQSPSVTSPIPGIVDFQWLPPASDGGSPVTSYTVYRSSTLGGETTLQTGIIDTSFQDPTATTGTEWFYVVTAVNAYGESGRSVEVSITP